MRKASRLSICIQCISLLLQLGESVQRFFHRVMSSKHLCAGCLSASHLPPPLHLLVHLASPPTGGLRRHRRFPFKSHDLLFLLTAGTTSRAINKCLNETLLRKSSGKRKKRLKRGSLLMVPLSVRRSPGEARVPTHTVML